LDSDGAFHAEARIGFHEVLQQGRLADARLTPDDQRLSVAAHRPVHRSLERRTFGMTAVQDRGIPIGHVEPRLPTLLLLARYVVGLRRAGSVRTQTPDEEPGLP